MDTHHKQWNERQQQLRKALSTKDYQKAVEFFLDQHAMLHAAKISKTKLWSFEDELLNDVTEAHIRCVPPGEEHSIAWNIFHIARCEDITMNMLAAGAPQLFLRDGWEKKLNIAICHSGNSMDTESMSAFNTRVNLDALQAYRLSVGRRTREIVKKLKPEDFPQKVASSQMQKIMDEGALLPDATGVFNYWSTRTVAGLLLMPPTRHNLIHLNEALRIKQKLQR